MAGGVGAGCGSWGARGAAQVAQWEETVATCEHKSLRAVSRLDVVGVEGVAQYTSWVEVRISTWAVRKVTEEARSLTMAISWARRGVRASLRSGKIWVGVCNDPTIGSYNYYHLSPNGIPSGNQRWYGLV